MLQIRESVFETNSSSTHSIAVLKEGRYSLPTDPCPSTYATYEDGILYLGEDNNFGWGWEVLTGWLDKFAYAVADLGQEKAGELLERIKQRLNCDEIVIPRRTLWNDPSKTEPDYGYVDHQSCGMLQSFLHHKEVDVLDFIFDEHYIVILDNDNNYGDRKAAYIQKLDPQEEFPYPYCDCWW